MKPEDIHLSDFQRILIGEIPASFFLELILRALIIYIVLIISMRLMGKRMSSQIGRNEMAAVVSLAAAVGIPLMNPDRGLLPGVVIAVVIIAFQLIIGKIAAKNEKFEAVTQDEISTLVNEGIIDLHQMKKARISRERLFAQLRVMHQFNLGTVERLYLEANGLFSLVSYSEKKTGLSLLPEWDKEFNAKMTLSQDHCACYNCGKLYNKPIQNSYTRCENCGDSHWTDAVE